MTILSGLGMLAARYQSRLYLESIRTDEGESVLL